MTMPDSDLDAINKAISDKAGQPVIVIWSQAIPFARILTGEGSSDQWSIGKCYGVLTGEPLTQIKDSWHLPTTRHRIQDARGRQLSDLTAGYFEAPSFCTFTVAEVRFFEGVIHDFDEICRPRCARIIAGEEAIREHIRSKPEIAVKLACGSKTQMGIEAATEADRIFHQVMEKCGFLELTAPG